MERVELLARTTGDEVLASGCGSALLGEGADDQDQLCRSSQSQLRRGDVAHHDPTFQTAATVFFTEAAEAIQAIRGGLLRGKIFPATESWQWPEWSAGFPLRGPGNRRRDHKEPDARFHAGCEGNPVPAIGQ